MREFKLGKSTVTFPIESSGRIQVVASSKKPVSLYGVCEGEEIPLAYGENISFKETLSSEFTAVKLVGTGATPFGYSYYEKLVFGSDPQDDSAPPAIDTAQPANLVQQFQRLLKANRKLSGPPVLEPDMEGPWAARYAVEDDDFRFEEDIAAETARSRQKKADVAPDTPSEPRTGPSDVKAEPDRGNSQTASTGTPEVSPRIAAE